MGALDGIRILDLTRVLAGPWCTQLLADLGAEVIKIERPGEGDDTRAWGPPWQESSLAPGVTMSSYFMSANRGKKSVAIDIARPEGAALVRELASHCDVLVENFKVGGLAKYGLSYADLKQSHPRLVYASITGFGQDGPYAERPGYDFIVQGMGGLMGVTGEPGGEAMRAGVAITDIMTGMYAANGILAALLQRARTGCGQQIDIALLDVQVATMANQALAYLVTGQNPARHGNAHASIVPYQAFAARDGSVTIAAGNDGQFRRLCATIGEPSLATDPRYATNAARVANRVALIDTLQRSIARWDMHPLLAALQREGVPAGPINRLSDVFADPQVRHRGMAFTQASPTLGPVPAVRCPLRFSGAEIGAAAAPPALAADTGDVLRDLLQMKEGRREALLAAGVTG